MRRWFKSGALRHDLTEAEALDVLWAMTSPDVFALLVDERRWMTQRYSAWLDEQLPSLLLHRKQAKR